MKICIRRWFSRGAGVLVCLGVAAGLAAGASGPHYVVTNDDTLYLNGVTFYTVGTNGGLTLQEQVQTGLSGIAGGYFAANRVVALDNETQECVYASNALTGEIVGIDVSGLEVGGSAYGSPSDTGASNGVGLAVNSQYLYASFTDFSTIGTFQVQPGCSLTFVSDVSVAGRQGGIISAMAIHGNMLIATYNDGSIESFNIASGAPVSNGDRQNSTAYIKSQGASYPNGVDITQDGHFAIFGDTSMSTSVEVSDISSGKLTKTVAYDLGGTINSSNIMLSPDETLLYITNSQGDRITAAFFNAGTGALASGCTSGKIRNYVSSWSYLVSLGMETSTGTGEVLYVAEYGAASGIAMLQVTSAGGACSLAELSTSPVADPNSPGLLSIATFPPRGF